MGTNSYDQRSNAPCSSTRKLVRQHVCVCVCCCCCCTALFNLAHRQTERRAPASKQAISMCARLPLPIYVCACNTYTRNAISGNFLHRSSTQTHLHHPTFLCLTNFDSSTHLARIPIAQTPSLPTDSPRHFVIQPLRVRACEHYFHNYCSRMPHPHPLSTDVS